MALSVKAGAAVDGTIGQLEPPLDPGDILIDVCNSLFSGTERRVGDRPETSIVCF